MTLSVLFCFSIDGIRCYVHQRFKLGEDQHFGTQTCFIAWDPSLGTQPFQSVRITALGTQTLFSEWGTSLATHILAYVRGNRLQVRT